ncbi:MAG: TIGR03862 family flavoprotein [Geminicoccaceae bacterium]
MSKGSVAVVGAGPAGLMAAETLSASGFQVTLYERMPRVGRKLLLAGRGGLNLTHAEERAPFLSRYGSAEDRLTPIIDGFPAASLRAWAHGLGQDTFVGSSGRIFPVALKASPLLRAWLAHLGGQGVQLRTMHEWVGWDGDGRLIFRLPDGSSGVVAPAATVLALGGASWPRLGADGSWVSPVAATGIEVTPLRPSNCGFTVAWSHSFRSRFAGQPLKKVTLNFHGRTVPGEVMVTEYGIEGGVVYALSARLRDAIAATGPATVYVDLRPDMPTARLAARLARVPAAQSVANTLRKGAGLEPVAINLLRESGPLPSEPERLAALIKAVPLLLTAPQALARAISTAGGVALAEVDGHLMLHRRPGTFVAGEMLDWEAPTGGYLLQAVLATGRAAALGVRRWLEVGGRDQSGPGTTLSNQSRASVGQSSGTS